MIPWSIWRIWEDTCSVVADACDENGRGDAGERACAGSARRALAPCAAQRYIRLAVLQSRSACQVPAVRKGLNRMPAHASCPGCPLPVFMAAHQSMNRRMRAARQKSAGLLFLCKRSRADDPAWGIKEGAEIARQTVCAHRHLLSRRAKPA